jgi:hypothetical protein
MCMCAGEVPYLHSSCGDKSLKIGQLSTSSLQLPVLQMLFCGSRVAECIWGCLNACRALCAEILMAAVACVVGMYEALSTLRRRDVTRVLGIGLGLQHGLWLHLNLSICRCLHLGQLATGCHLVAWEGYLSLSLSQQWVTFCFALQEHCTCI